MKRFVTAVALTLALAVPAFAVEGVQPPKGPEPTYEQRKADILKRIDARISALQDERACVQATKNQDDLNACRDKFKAKAEQAREEMKKRNPQRRQQGPGGPGEQAPAKGK